MASRWHVSLAAQLIQIERFADRHRNARDARQFQSTHSILRRRRFSPFRDLTSFMSKTPVDATGDREQFAIVTAFRKGQPFCAPACCGELSADARIVHQTGLLLIDRRQRTSTALV